MNVSDIILHHSRADRSLRALVDACLNDFDLTLMEWLLLSVVKNGPKEGLSMSAVASELNVTLPQVTALMTSVVKKKYAKLKTQRKDRRSRHALLTTRGEQVLKNTDARSQKLFDLWFKELTRPEIDSYVAVLQKLAYKTETPEVSET